MNVTVALRELAEMANAEPSQSGDGSASEEKAAVVAELAELLGEQVLRLNTYQLSTCIWAFAKLGGLPEPLLERLLARALTQLTEFSDVQLCKLLWALGRMRHHPGEEWLAPAAAEAEKRAPGLDTQGLSNVAWALARLSSRPEGLLKALARAAEEKADAFTAQGLCNFLYAMAILRYGPGQLLDVLADTASKKLQDFSPKGVANTMWAFSQLGYRPTALLDEVAARIDLQFAYCTHTDAAVLLVATARIASSSTGSSSSSDGDGGSAADDRGDVSRVSSEAAASTSSSSGRSSARDDSGKEGAGARYTELIDYLLARLFAGERAQRLKPEEVAAVLWALGKMRHHPSSCLKPLSAAVASRVGQLKGQALSNVVWAVARLNGAHAWDLELQQQLLQQVLRPQRFTPQHLANIAWAAGRLDPQDECKAVLVLLAQQAADRVEEVGPHHATLLLWAMAKKKVGMGQQAGAEPQRMGNPVLDPAMMSALAGYQLAAGSGVGVAASGGGTGSGLGSVYSSGAASSSDGVKYDAWGDAASGETGREEGAANEYAAAVAAAAAAFDGYASDGNSSADEGGYDSDDEPGLELVAAAAWPRSTWSTSKPATPAASASSPSAAASSQGEGRSLSLSSSVEGGAGLREGRGPEEPEEDDARQSGMVEDSEEGEAAARLIRQLGNAWVTSSPALFNDQDVTLLLWAVARLDRRLPPRAEAAAAEWLAKKAGTLPTQQLAMATWALARMGPPLSEDQVMLDAVVQAAPRHVDALASRDLANLVHSLGRFGYCPDEHLLDTLAVAAADRMHSLSPDELVNTLWGFAMLGHHPGALLGMVAKRAESGTLALDPWHLSCLSWCAYRLGHTADDTVGAGIRNTEARMRDEALAAEGSSVALA